MSYVKVHTYVEKDYKTGSEAFKRGLSIHRVQSMGVNAIKTQELCML